MAATVTVGPVIGRVTPDSARVLVEVDRDATVTCILRDPQGGEVTATRDLPRHRPRAFAVGGLAPGTAYDVSFAGASCTQPGRVRTRADDATGLNAVAVSCNRTPKRGEVDLWDDLRRRYVRPGQVDLLLHLGDQIYGDDAFQEAVDRVGDRSLGRRPSERRILEAYRRLYRLTWRHPPTREVLASVPNLMIWDDHEIRDDWGSREADLDPGSVSRYVGGLARRVYREYQRQLWDDPFDPDAEPADGLEHHMHRMGRFGFLFVDQRGGRSFGRDDQRPYLSAAQWRDIRGAFLDGGVLADANVVVVATSVPLVYLESDVSSLGDTFSFVDDLRDHWAYPPHQREQIDLIRLLRGWKEAARDRREILVVGGDVHVGAQTEIRHHDTPIFKQLITSPITNRPPSLPLSWGLQVMLEASGRIGASYHYDHSGLTNHRNYGFLTLRASAGRKPTVRAELEREP